MAANNDWDHPKRPTCYTPLHPAAARPGGADPITQRGPMNNPNPLSSAAQAVLDAANGASSYSPDDCLNDAPQVAVATLRALVANHGIPTKGGSIILNGDDVLDIATELEQQA